MDNIDKKQFNINFAYYITLPIEEQERYYTKHLHRDIEAIIYNVCFYFKFNSEHLTREDVKGELRYQFLYKLPKIKQGQGNFYNYIFTVLKNKLLDILRSHKAKQARRDTLFQLRKDFDYLLRRGQEFDADFPVADWKKGEEDNAE